jgi:alginate O-acetyltransferase
MLFSSIVFLSIFLPSLIILYFSVKKSFRNYILLIYSLIFYAWGEPRYLSVMLCIILINYLTAILIDKNKNRKIILIFDILLNLFVLIYFKYFNFIVININKVLKNPLPKLNVIMPIGISFFIFQAISYVFDVYKNEVPVQKNIYKLTLYISFFPQLIAGPIVKYHEVQKEIENRNESLNNIYLGLFRFSIGLGKKVLIANTLGEVVDKIFMLDIINTIDYKIAWIGAICYSLQLYFDFSGYSDMAIGLGKVFGFKFLENFNYPYVSKSITEFWRRWHISLGTWFKEYLYIPLGGNRKSSIRTYINLFIVFLATGIWHGAKWTFVIWGLWHGIFIIIERKIKIEKYDKKCEIFIRHIYTLFIIITGWVLFRAENMSYGIKFLKIMFGISKNSKIPYSVMYFLDRKVILALLIGLIASVNIFKLNIDKYYESKSFMRNILLNMYSIIILILSYMSILSSTYNPFIYFRF